MINNKQFDLNNIECVLDITLESAASYSGGASAGVILFGTTQPDGENSEERNFLFVGRADQNSSGESEISRGAFFFGLPDERQA